MGVARVSHWVVVLDTELRPNKIRVHAAFTAKRNAEAYMDKLNVDLDEDEDHAFVLTQYNSFLSAEFLEGKLCYRVEFHQKAPTKISQQHVVSTAPPLNTDSALSRGDFDQTGRQSVSWVGWAESTEDAVRRARIRAISSWVNP